MFIVFTWFFGLTLYSIQDIKSAKIRIFIAYYFKMKFTLSN